MTAPALLTALVDTTLKEADYATYLPDLYATLFAANAKLFVRKYDPAVCARGTNHIFPELPVVPAEEGSYTCILSPNEVRLMNSKFYVVWSVELAAEIDIDVDVDVPLMDEVVTADSTPAPVQAPAPAPVTQSAVQTIELVELDDIESDKDETGSEASIPLRSGLTDRQIRERQRVEEARLRAKLAAFRAQRAMDRYIQKYGDLTDSDATEYTETDVESDDESD
jgi:hypothetical protein